MTIEVTVVDRTGDLEDAGPFSVECMEDEADALRRLAGVPFGQLVDGLRELDDRRPDMSVRRVADAVEEFGECAELEVSE